LNLQTKIVFNMPFVITELILTEAVDHLSYS